MFFCRSARVGRKILSENFKKALDNATRLRYYNHAVFETAGAGIQRKAMPPAEKRA